jgi:imidazolonepropionase-like amidohydrolase
VLYTVEEMDAAREAAKEYGLWIATHAYTDEAVDLALRAGARIIYHASYISERMAEKLAAHKDEVFYGPGCGVSVAALEASPRPISTCSMKNSAAERMELESKLVPDEGSGRAHADRRGLWLPFNPNGRNARDIQHFVDYFGYTPVEALAAATGLGGELMGLDVGLIQEGYLADLLLVDGDPTQDVAIFRPRTISRRS